MPAFRDFAREGADIVAALDDGVHEHDVRDGSGEASEQTGVVAAFRIHDQVRDDVPLPVERARELP